MRTIGIDDLNDEATFAGVQLRNGDLHSQPVRQLTMRKSELTMVGVAAAHLDGLTFEDVRAERCDLANVRIELGRWTRVGFEACKLTGAVLDKCLLQDVRFDDCKMDYIELQSITCRRMELRGCNLSHACFHDSDLTGVRLRDCDLREVDFSKATLTGADLRGSNLERIVITVDQLRDVTVTTDQAIYLCGLIGLRIDDEVGLSL